MRSLRGILPTFVIFLITLALLGIGTISSPPSARASGGISYGLGPNAPVWDVAVADDGTAFVGGEFTHWGVQTGGLALLNADDATASRSFPGVIDGTVEAIVPDGSGGYFIGGLFWSVDGIDRENLAHIDANGAVSDWQPETSYDQAEDGMVMSLALENEILYVGGRFDEVYDGDGDGPFSRRLLAAVDAETGEWLDWAPDPFVDGGGWWNLYNEAVFDMLVRNDVLYVGGNFEFIGGVGAPGSEPQRAGAAAFDLTDLGTDEGLLDWTPDTDGPVLALADVETGIAVGGLFGNLRFSGQNPDPHASLAVVEYSGAVNEGQSTAFELDVLAAPFPGSVEALAYESGPGPTSRLYFGGGFDQLDEPNDFDPAWAQDNVGVVDVATGTVGAWAPDPNSYVTSIAVVDGAPVIGGNFTTAGGASRNGLARFDESLSSNPTALDADFDDADVRAIVGSGASLLVGGGFATANSVPVNHLAKVNSDGTLDQAFDLDLPAGVNEIYTVPTMTSWNGSIYAALWNASGSVTHEIVEVETTTGGVTPLVLLNGRARGMTANEERLFVVGEFTSVSEEGPVARSYGFALASDNSLASWAPALADSADDAIVTDGDVYIVGRAPGGIGTLPAAVRAPAAGNGTLDTWSGDFTAGGAAQYGTAYAVTEWNGSIVVGGRMLNSTSPSDNGTSLEALSASTAAVSWNPLLSGRSQISDFLVDDAGLYFAGSGYFDTGGSLSVGPGIGLFNNSRELVEWGPTFEGSVDAMVSQGDELLVGGNFVHADGARAGSPRAYLAWVAKYVAPQGGGGGTSSSAGGSTASASTQSSTAPAAPGAGQQAVANEVASVRKAQVYFGDTSAVLTTRARDTLRALVKQVSRTGRAGASAQVRAMLSASGATASDRALARKRALVVSAYLKGLGIRGKVSATAQRAKFAGTWTDRRVDVRLEWR